ncbi:probable E3 ubiquitin-protein ligase TRIML1 [Erinaceus europaeus]|uniref:Probable E3 ubiquitin-protein ligase TRIML1 n=1 Tax=Erinaceus europaeus TaxID=9365 RepID=A0ABM3VT92_ERIEU|nr:probable E3 ubiquitin-protein ligase TRIML1 [Erinaceus europaeus]
MSFFEKMSTIDLIENLREELTCFICMDYFTSPVTTECGHSFCLVCLLRSWEEHNAPLSCPECWRTLDSPNFQPNERLGRLAAIGKQLRFQMLQSEGEHRRMLAAAKEYTDHEQGANAFSAQCHGANRAHLSSEAEEHHKEKLQEILNRLRKRKKEAQIILTHEKERVILCKVSIYLSLHLVHDSVEWYKAYPVEYQEKKTNISSPSPRTCRKDSTSNSFEKVKVL